MRPPRIFTQEWFTAMQWWRDAAWIKVDREGTSAHYWFGPAGVHLFRRGGEGSPIQLAWSWLP